MEYPPRTVILKDGTSSVIRSLVPDDASAAIRYLKQVFDETDNLARYPEEFSLTPEEEAQVLRDAAHSPRSVMLGAFVGNQLASLIFLFPFERQKMAHRGQLGLSVRKEFWGRGLGRNMMSAVLECARRSGLEQVELEVVADNLPALDLYRKAGFSVYGMRPRGFRLRDGSYRDELLMLRTL